MKTVLTFANALLVASAVQANFMCPVVPGSSDAVVVEFGLAVQTLLSEYYKSIPVNASFFATLPNNTGTDYLSNAMGLVQQADLGVMSLQQLEVMTNASMPSCKYTFPPVTDAMSFFMNAYQIEATLCGTFIGLADYVMSPQVAFLMARLAAEHGIHASYIGSHLKPQVFMSNSTSLTPAFTPQEVLNSGMGVGMLGQYMNGCAVAPVAPCSGMVSIGELGANLTNQGANNVSSTAISKLDPASASSTEPATFTGAAQSSLKGVGGAMAGAGLAAVAIM